MMRDKKRGKRTLEKIVSKIKVKADDISEEVMNILKEIKAVKEKKVIGDEEKDKKEDEEEIEIEETERKEKGEDRLFKHPDYEEIAFVNELYRSRVDYNELFSYLGAKSKEEIKAYQEEIVKEEKGEMKDEEADKFVKKVQHQLVVKSHEVLDAKDRERFSYWQAFHKVKLLLYDKTAPIRTNDVDYGRINSFIFN